MRRKPALAALLLAVALAVASLSRCDSRAEVEVSAVLDGYRAIAHASYRDALHQAEILALRIDELIAAPGEDTLRAARQAWRAARVPYAQTEALRFGHWFVDEWEARVNAWPLDEGFIDYVASPYPASSGNLQARANLVANDSLSIGGSTLPLTTINRSLLISAQGRSDSEANIATGYHAIEFLLWGQDLNPQGPGQRPWSDYALSAEHCSDGAKAAPLRHCQRRAAVLRAAAEQLVWDLREMAPVWGPQPGSFGDRLVRGDPAEGLRRALYGLIRMASFELAGERQQVALLSHSPEEEQDCFSDDTHQSLYFNAVGIENLYYGRYGEQHHRPRLADLAAASNPALAQQLDEAFSSSRQALAAIRQAGEQGETFDRLIQPRHSQGRQLIQRSIAALNHQAQLLETLGQQLGLGPLNPQAPRVQPDA